MRGDVLEFAPVSGDYIVRVDFFGDEIERIVEVDDLTGEVLAERPDVNIYPATHYVTPRDKMLKASRRSRPRWRSGSPSSAARVASWRPRGCSSAPSSTPR